MQTQHKVQLDARDKGQAPAGQPGPYQVTPALIRGHTSFVSCVAFASGPEDLPVPPKNIV